MKIGGLQRVSLIDYPGAICAVVFTQGCNFRCQYCHNPELVDTALFHPAMDESEFFNFLHARKGKLDAVVVTGGEPTIHGDLESFVSRIRKLGFAVKLDTNGSNPQAVKTLLNKKLLDYIAMDVKAPFEKYKDIVRRDVDTDSIRETIGIVLKAKIPHEFRTTVVRSQLKEKDIRKIADQIAGATKYVLQKFVPSKTLEEGFATEKSYSDPELEKIKQSLEERIPCVVVR
ncbi:MAG TPA: anaerobic ribonucleoside-triphosphate reductase activating protein [Smithella sp.]|nr:anaerobic ribonucleoside-triphosphate reductase activating protein [Smithella sp.]